MKPNKKNIRLPLTFFICICTILTSIPFFPSLTISASNVSSNINDGSYYIKTKMGNWCDTRYQDSTNGAVFQIWKDCNQSFTLKRLSDGTYKIIVDHSGKVIEVSNSSHEKGADVQQWDYLDNYDCKRWYIYDCGDSWYKFVNKESGLCLDIDNGSDVSGTRLQQWSDNGSDAQLFKLIPKSNTTNKSSENASLSYDNLNLFIGDKVELNGSYYTSSKGGKIGKNNSGTYIIDKIAPNTPYPYAIRPINGNYISGWASPSVLIPDFTDDIINGIAQDVGTLFVVFDSLNIKDAILKFYNTVKNKGPLDIKWEDNWNAKFKHKFIYNQKFIFNDVTLTPDRLGNVIYGMVGRSLGIGDKMLYWGGGFQHLKNTYPDLTTTQILNLNELYDASLYYGDLPEDHNDIEYGISLVNSNTDIVFNFNSSFEEWIIKRLAPVISKFID